MSRLLLIVLMLAAITSPARAQPAPSPVKSGPPPLTIVKDTAPKQRIIPAMDDAPTVKSDNLGIIVQVEGTVAIKGGAKDAKPSPTAANAPFHLNDTVTTGPKSRALLLLVDGTQMILGENASFSLDDYSFDPAQPGMNKARFNFASGAFLYVSGLVAKAVSPDVKLETPHGSIGIRGTVVWGGQIDESYRVLVLEGRVTADSPRGRVGADTGQAIDFRNSTKSVPNRAIWSPERFNAALSMIAIKDPFEAEAQIAKIRQTHEGFTPSRPPAPAAPAAAPWSPTMPKVDLPTMPVQPSGPSTAPEFEKLERKDLEKPKEVYVPREKAL